MVAAHAEHRTFPPKTPEAHPVSGVQVCLEGAEHFRAGDAAASRWTKRKEGHEAELTHVLGMILTFYFMRSFPLRWRRNHKGVDPVLRTRKPRPQRVQGQPVGPEAEPRGIQAG